MRARAGGQRGYTVAEVVMAVSVLGLGAMGVIGMQKATLYNNTNARNLATANAIAQAWMERLRADSLAWTDANHIPNLVTATEWLQAVGNGPGTTGWITPATSNFPAAQPAGIPVADIMGTDLFAASPMPPAFCTEIRLTRFDNGLGGPLPAYTRLIRAEVRVGWLRNNQTVTCPLPAGWDQPGCTPPQLCAPGDYGSVYLVSAVSENQAPNASP
jgi:type IV pilus assembly protein PilV